MGDEPRAGAPLRATDLPCPPWCILRGEHSFTLLNGYGVLVRTHEAQPWEGAGVHVTLFCEELAQSEREPEPQRNTHISLDSWPDGCLTGPDARRLAAALLNAADEWDESTLTAP